ncbi:CotH kinase family protein [Spirosoma sp. BT702]|uniref:CotH kinase family protein n=1 Tax=Spirosoma profusum TaxID=2771354 RepID=A0A926XXC9_9BACT|nr:CotH kinase family protein [Spirosoma profusum]MBD2701776.1 CotH kinase family protein [Spirosoma profusum]
MKKLYLLHLFCLFYFVSLSVRGQQLYINEIMASNGTTLADSSGSYEGWFEIYNPASTTVDIGGYYVTDNLTNPTKYRIPTGSPQTIIPANGYIVLWASEALSRGPLHVGFKLSADGEAIGLFSPATTVVNQVIFGPQRSDVSWGRQPDGSEDWIFFKNTPSVTNISPGASNNGRTGYPVVLNAPTFSQNGGFYADSFNLTITSNDPGVTIYYTLDGSEPDPTNLTGATFQYKNSFPEFPGQPFGSFLTDSSLTYTYSGPILIRDRTNDANRISTKASSYFFTVNYFPVSPVFKGTVVRAVAYKEGELASDIVTQTYFVTPNGSQRYTIPVVSVATSERNLFDYNTGIFTAGAAFDNWRTANPDMDVQCGGDGEYSNGIGNYSNEGDAWQRPGNVEFFLGDNAVINQEVGLRIHGGCSRMIPPKSLRLYSNAEFRYPFFSNRPNNQFYNRLLLRSGGNLWHYSNIPDPYAQTIVQHLPFDTQANRPGIIFMNGEFHGVYTLNERYDKYYLNRNYDVDTDSVDIVSIAFGYKADEGDLTRYFSLVDYCNLNEPVSYSYMSSQMDIENFTDYQISEIFLSNVDWPQNNMMCWRKRTSSYLPNAPKGHDGRFRWMMKDMDLSLGFLGGSSRNTLEWAMQSPLNLFLPKLLALPSYRTYFINRFADLLNTTFDSTRTIALLNTMQQAYQPYITEHYHRWITGTTVTSWIANLDEIRNFLRERPTSARNHILSQLNVSGTNSLTVDVSSTAAGYVKVNTIDILPTTVGVSATPYPWKGIYFQGNPIRLVAKAKAGFVFTGWQDAGVTISTDTAYSYTPFFNRKLVAVFEIDYSDPPTPHVLSNGEYRFDSWSASAPAGTYPAHMHLVSMNQADPPLSASFARADTVKGAYNLNSSTRINGMEANGLSFINTGGSNPGYVGTLLGAAVLALKTTGVSKATVQWVGGTVTPGSRQYRIRLRYRIGNTGPFQDLLDASDQIVEYVRSETANHSSIIGPVDLPAPLLNQPYIQLAWQYYYTGVGTSGTRDQLRLDDIIITPGDRCWSVTSGNWYDTATWNCGRTPTVQDHVIIKTGHQVNISTYNTEIKSLRLEGNGRLVYGTPSANIFIIKP